LAAHIALTDKWRVNVIGSYQHISYAGYIDRPPPASPTSTSRPGAAANIYSPVPNLDLGLNTGTVTANWSTG
jgi:hypothetical protein